jgi:hypothetical protein
MKTKIVNGAEVTEIPVDPSKTNDRLEREAAGPKRPAPSDANKYEVAKIKTFRGMEGEGLNAVLLKNGKKVADILDEGNGGEMYYDWIDMNKGVEEGQFQAFVEFQRGKIPADKVDADGFNDHNLFCADIWVWDEANRILDDRRNSRACKKTTIFQVGDKIGSEEWRTIKGVTPDVRAYVEKKYAGQKIVFMNDRYK